MGEKTITVCKLMCGSHSYLNKNSIIFYNNLGAKTREEMKRAMPTVEQRKEKGARSLAFIIFNKTFLVLVHPSSPLTYRCSLLPKVNLASAMHKIMKQNADRWNAKSPSGGPKSPYF